MVTAATRGFKVARITRGLTQRELGALVGLPEHRITGIETGRFVRTRIPSGRSRTSSIGRRSKIFDR